MEAARQYNVHEAKTHFSRILEQVATGEEVVIGKAGEPVALVVPLRPKVRRTGRGSLRGQMRRLPAHHRDPFDRFLVAQAQTEGMTLVTRDKWIPQYEVPVMLAGR
ncbi:type II toxin-antitoxin system prevent-host-death family antitoxin [Streptomyces sp. NPDC059161]|uniref:type II toxin-antitoxin system prevent-host-death family antitoxin n=1 Tax=Streptomyces sp. NPDC059161 TaxID=3346749 RepID=UPI0036AEF120